uniref:Na+/H+ antiporter NhaA n=1 Tax=Vibrio sp. TaxID=678 RepID=UPI003D0A44A3
IVIPIFSLANAGIPVDWRALDDTITHPVSLGIIAGLVLGKLLGIVGFSWLAVKIGVTSLPKELNLKHLIGVGLMGGIGFTMSIFIAELGFANYPEDLLMAKSGILIASALAGISGFVWLYLTSNTVKENKIEH